MRIVIANPPGFGGPDYDHHLCSALAARGEDVELVTTRFRFGQMPEPEGYRRSLVFYPLSARLFGRSRLRVPLKVAEHPFGLAQLALRHPDVVHVQWLSIPEVDRVLLRSRAPLVYTAHDNAQRRTSSKKGVWDALYRRFQRVVAHSQSPAATRSPSQGVPEHKLRVIPHPIIRSDPAAQRRRPHAALLRPDPPLQGHRRRDRGDARLDEGGRLLVAGDPMEPVDGYQRRAGEPGRVAARLPAAEPRSTAPTATPRWPSSPTGPGSTSPGRCCARWARASRPSPTTSAAWARTCAGSAPGGSCPPATWRRWRPRCASCSTIRPRMAEARAGALRARDTLTWDGLRAHPHRALPGAGGRRGRG